MPGADVSTKYTIIKEGSDPAFNGQNPQTRSYTITNPVPPEGMPSGPGVGGARRRRKVARTFPRGILRKTTKIHPSGNPSKAPPTRKRSIRLMTEHGIDKARKTARARAQRTDIATIRRKLVEKKIIGGEKDKNIPPAVLRTLYIDSVGAGLLS